MINILLVDDDRNLLDLTKQYLEDSDDNLRVSTATSPYQVLQSLDAADQDVIISDYDMPGITGLELLQKVRQRGNTTPFFLLTGKGSGSLALRVIRSGASGYFLKKTDLQSVINKMLIAIKSSVSERKGPHDCGAL